MDRLDCNGHDENRESFAAERDRTADEATHAFEDICVDARAVALGAQWPTASADICSIPLSSHFPFDLQLLRMPSFFFSVVFLYFNKACSVTRLYRLYRWMDSRSSVLIFMEHSHLILGLIELLAKQYPFSFRLSVLPSKLLFGFLDPLLRRLKLPILLHLHSVHLFDPLH